MNHGSIQFLHDDVWLRKIDQLRLKVGSLAEIEEFMEWPRKNPTVGTEFDAAALHARRMIEGVIIDEAVVNDGVTISKRSPGPTFRECRG